MKEEWRESYSAEARMGVRSPLPPQDSRRPQVARGESIAEEVREEGGKEQGREVVPVSGKRVQLTEEEAKETDATEGGTEREEREEMGKEEGDRGQKAGAGEEQGEAKLVQEERAAGHGAAGEGKGAGEGSRRAEEDLMGGCSEAEVVEGLRQLAEGLGGAGAGGPGAGALE
eukprot:2361927-Rhodomonas_salina.1